jgi:hypothetical protein
MFLRQEKENQKFGKGGEGNKTGSDDSQTFIV